MQNPADAFLPHVAGERQLHSGVEMFVFGGVRKLPRDHRRIEAQAQSVRDGRQRQRLGGQVVSREQIAGPCSGAAGGNQPARHGVGKRWRARYFDDNGKEYTQHFERKTDAKQWLAGVSASMVTGTYTAPEAGRVTVGATYASWSAAQAHISAKTAATRRSTWGSRVEPRWGHVAVVDVKTSAARAWVAQLVADGVGVPGIETCFGLLRQIMGAAVEDRAIPRNPTTGVKLPKRQHADRGYLSHRQLATLADAVERDGIVVRFPAYTGLRYGEMAALRVADFDMLRRRVNVSRSVTDAAGAGLVWSTPKTWERRSVPFPAALADDLAALMVGKGRDDLVSGDQRGGGADANESENG